MTLHPKAGPTFAGSQLKSIYVGFFYIKIKIGILNANQWAGQRATNKHVIMALREDKIIWNSMCGGP